MKKHTRKKTENDAICVEEKKKKKKRKILRIVTAVLLSLTIVTGIAVCGIYFSFMKWAQSANFDSDLLPTAKAYPTFVDSYGNKIDYISDSYVRPEEIPENVKQAFIALEDRRFYKHKGYDAKAIGRALITNLKARKAVEGGSTITQQLVKNTHLSSEKTLERKLNEIAIAMKIEENFDKDEILAMYLSVIYFGGGAYGIKDAAKLYFDCGIDELTLDQAATLAGILKNPSRYSPRNSLENATERRNLVLDVMKREGYISESECEEAKSRKMKISSDNPETESVNQFYLERAAREACEILGITRYQLDNSGITVVTALDGDVQALLAEQTRSRSNYSDLNVDGAALLLDNESGEIRGYYSTLDYEISRQGGSALKPITVYAPALDTGSVTLATPVTDEPTDFNGYAPENFGGVYYGRTTPREAVKKSMNTVAVKIMSYTGIDKCTDYASRMGIALSDRDKNLALALGATSQGTNPAALAGAYAVFARGGSYVKPHYIRAIIREGRKIYSAETLSRTQVISPQTAYLMTDCLKDTVRTGTARSLSVLPFEIASKTGTVQKNREINTDAWNLSFTSEHTLAVWHGAERMTELGGGYPTRHAARIWKNLYSQTRPTAFPCPEGVVRKEIDLYSTYKNRMLTKATPFTPREMVAEELFNVAFLPSSSVSRFENPTADFTLSVNGNRVVVTFEAEPVFSYRLLCRDLLGVSLVKEINPAPTEGNSTDVTEWESVTEEVSHTPFSFSTPVSYTLQVYNRDSRYPQAEITKTCFPGNAMDG